MPGLGEYSMEIEKHFPLVTKDGIGAIPPKSANSFSQSDTPLSIHEDTLRSSAGAA